jgi:hypothetical protein
VGSILKILSNANFGLTTIILPLVPRTVDVAAAAVVARISPVRPNVDVIVVKAAAEAAATAAAVNTTADEDAGEVAAPTSPPLGIEMAVEYRDEDGSWSIIFFPRSG